MVSLSRDTGKSRFCCGMGPLLRLVVALLVGFGLGRMDGSNHDYLASMISINTPTAAVQKAVDPTDAVQQVVVSSSAAANIIDNNDPIKDFYTIARKSKTDKAGGPDNFAKCAAASAPGAFNDPAACPRHGAVNPQCRVMGHFYHNVYQRWLGEYSRDGTEPFQFLEIGIGMGRSVPAWTEFLPAAERHYMDSACIPHVIEKQSAFHQNLYRSLLDINRLHCGSSADFDFLHQTYKTMRRNGEAPPLKVVVEDASHIPAHMSAALFFWMPRIEPGGLLFLEDIEPNTSPKLGGHAIQTDLVPQIVHDVHYCGDPDKPEEPPCLPSVVNLIQSVHCDLHICVFERSKHVPAYDPPREESVSPKNALYAEQCLAERKSIGN